MKNSKFQRGFALYIALITMGVLTLVAFSISKIAFKEVTLSRIGKESQIAFYAADTGVECALYGDVKLWESDLFPLGENGSRSISCGEGSAEITFRTETSGEISTTTSSFLIGQIGDGSACTDVKVYKVDSNGDDFVDKTIIESNGRNDCVTSSRQIERGIRVSY